MKIHRRNVKFDAHPFVDGKKLVFPTEEWAPGVMCGLEGVQISLGGKQYTICAVDFDKREVHLDRRVQIQFSLNLTIEYRDEDDEVEVE